ncbi:MAG: septum formation protein Maf [Clostridiales bacterium]|nr:septum formation protein Maf [Clostridiales bacterium]
MSWILASASPRRKELLAELIKEFEVIPSSANEEVKGKLSAKALVETLASRKAEEVAFREENAGKFVLGSDTVVVFGKEVLGKPKDEEDAFRMLKMLSGEKHEVWTGVCVASVKNGKYRAKVKAEKTSVYFNDLSDEWIWKYIHSGSPMDKAGAYGIQDGGLVKKIHGSYSNVVGLPLELCETLLDWAERKLQ